MNGKTRITYWDWMAAEPHSPRSAGSEGHSPLEVGILPQVPADILFRQFVGEDSAYLWTLDASAVFGKNSTQRISPCGIKTPCPLGAGVHGPSCGML